MFSKPKILWLAVTIAAALLAWGQDVVKTILLPFVEPLIKILQEKYPGVPFDINGAIRLALQVGSTIGIAIFVFGLILTILCFAGLFGACCNNACLLYT
ncbi:hypothetical protein Ciccas_009261, partial [Cichlidogyrus casuarinus]